MSQWSGVVELFGTIHLDRVGKVRREMEPLVEDADAVCIELPEEPSLLTYARAAIRAPLCVAGEFVFFLFGYAPLYLLFSRDLWPSELTALKRILEADSTASQPVDEELASNREETSDSPDSTPVYRVDDPPVKRLQYAGWKLVVPNWLGLGALLVYGPVATMTTICMLVLCGVVPVAVRRYGYRYPALALAVVGVVSWYVLFIAGFLSLLFVAGAAASFIIVVHFTFSDRNDVMTERVCNRGADQNHDQILLITGKGHLSGIIEILSQQNIDIGRVHTSKWLRSGRTEHSPDAVRIDTGTTASPDESQRDRSGPTDHPELASPIEPAKPDAQQKPEYSIAPLSRRAIAGVIDGFVAFICVVVTLVALVAVFEVVGDSLTTSNIYPVTLAGGIYGSVVGYRAGFDAILGGTIGKRLLNIALIEQSEQDVSLRTAIKRHLFWAADIVFLYLTVVFDDKNRLMCDHIAGTYVVKRRSE